ncbi:winged helix DNA-binding protein [Acidiphilium sp.]|uniref:winged helix DNA-binding protein n=1 Tax=Acidiphilium sp. TaxID=527 RepID=UPI00258BEB3A|nr:winged helix DNA-binding protein [Acidiphilium sp.]
MAAKPGRNAAQEAARKATAEPVVSSAHLAAGRSPGLSAVEFGLNLATMAYQRWMVRCMAAAGLPGLSPLEVLILHTVRHRNRPKQIADIMLVLDIEETHLVTYALRKLAAAGLIEVERAGKEKRVSASAAGIALCARYGEIRERLLVEAAAATGPGEASLDEVATVLRALSGIYNQAARAATTF